MEANASNILGTFVGKDVLHFSEISPNDQDALATAFGVDIVDVSPAIYRGTTLTDEGEILKLNCGHLGALDSLDGAALFHGGVMMRPVVPTFGRGARGAGGSANEGERGQPNLSGGAANPSEVLPKV